MRCDIIIPVWNQLERTRECIDSVRENTRASYRLVIIDNASDKPTKEYLESLRGALPGIVLKRNKDNLGFIKVVNQGMKESNSEYVCVLNNDTVVTAGWLSEMIGVAGSEGGIGVVNT